MPPGGSGCVGRLEGAVRSTPELLPRLKAAGVVDAGALGDLHLPGRVFHVAGGERRRLQADHGDLRGSSHGLPGLSGGGGDGVLHRHGARDRAGTRRMPPSGFPPSGRASSSFGTGSISRSISMPRTGKRPGSDLAAFGEVVRWSADDLDAQVHAFRRRPAGQACIS